MGIAPEVFWKMSLPEWRAALTGYLASRGLESPPALSRREFSVLMRRFPDVN